MAREQRKYAIAARDVFYGRNEVRRAQTPAVEPLIQSETQAVPDFTEKAEIL